MKKIGVVLLLFWSFEAFAQKNCEIVAHYDDFIKIKKYDKFLSKEVVKSTKKACYTDFINHNTSFFGYILTNFSLNPNLSKTLPAIAEKDSTQLQKMYLQELKTDTTFNLLMAEYADKVINKKKLKDTISSDYLMNIAVKYFSIMKINENDDLVGKVCVGLNDIKKTEKNRNAFLEAFCFSSIFKHYKSEEFNMYEEFVKALRELYKVNLGIEKSERLLRAQGGMYLLMRTNETLKKMLYVEYERSKDYLPFILMP